MKPTPEIQAVLDAAREAVNQFTIHGMNIEAEILSRPLRALDKAQEKPEPTCALCSKPYSEHKQSSGFLCPGADPKKYYDNNWTPIPPTTRKEGDAPCPHSQRQSEREGSNAAQESNPHVAAGLMVGGGKFDGIQHPVCPPANCEWRELANWMWTIICNAGGGDWSKESIDWQHASAKCRADYHALMSKERPQPAPEPVAPPTETCPVDQTYRCQFCDYEFFTKTELSRHQQTCFKRPSPPADTVPLEAKDVPIGSAVKQNDTGWTLINSVGMEGVLVCDIEISYTELAANWLINRNDGHGWVPASKTKGDR